MEDEEDFSPLESEEDFDPMGSDSDSSDAGEQSDSSVSADDDKGKDPAEDSQETVIYEGECRSYKVNTTSDKGEVVSSERGLALPLNQDAWDELGVVPMEGDEVIVVHGITFKEYGRVIDKNVATASFAGTHLTWRYGRN
jgi:hypothetical protein